MSHSDSLRSRIRSEWPLLVLAVSFFTRIPVKVKQEVTEETLNKASRYFALVGLLVGGISALVFVVCSSFLPYSISVIFAMFTSVLLTGAFHEDGWADVWDGFGGGWTVEQKLSIMKDSRLGTYGASALFFLLIAKYQSLMVIESVAFALILGHTLSRVVATSLIADMPYVQEDAKSKVKPLAQVLSSESYFILIMTGVLVLVGAMFLGFLSFYQLMQLVVVLAVIRWLMIKWFTQQLGGYTGDCLGAAQQLSEVIIYLFLVVTAYGSTVVEVNS